MRTKQALHHPSSFSFPRIVLCLLVMTWVSAIALHAQQGSTSLIFLTNARKYNQAGIDLGTTWKEVVYNDSAWPSGRGVLAVETNPVVVPFINTTLSLTNPAGVHIITYYFRTHFTFTNNPADWLYLMASSLIDDGAVVYINGSEVFRINLPAGPINSSTLASNAVEGVFVTNVFSAANIVIGDNVMAVEVHQTSATSSDVVFGLALDVVSPKPGLAILTTSTLIESGNFIYDAKDVIVDGATLTINGSHFFNSLLLTNGAVLTHSPCTATATYKLDLQVSNAIVVSANSRIDVSGLGYLPGRTTGNTTVGASSSGSGGSYGGFGGVWAGIGTVNALYGNYLEPDDWGSGGGGSGAGSGGGLLHLV